MRSIWLNTYEADKNVVMAQKPEDFAALRNSFFRTVHGVMMPYQPLTPAQHDDIMEYARVKLRADGKNYCNHNILTVVGERLEDALSPYPRGIDIILGDMRKAFICATGHTPGIEGFNINNFRPDEFHRHQATMTYTQNGLGTVGRNKQGGIYTAPTHYMFMMEKDFDHTAPDFMPCPDNPRVTYLMG